MQTGLIHGTGMAYLGGELRVVPPVLGCQNSSLVRRTRSRSFALVRLHPHSLVTSHTLAPAAGWFAIAKGSGPHELA